VFGVVSLWAVGRSGRPRELGRYKSAFQALAFSPDGRTLAAADGAGRIHLWCPRTGEEKGSLDASGGPVKALVFGPGGRTLAAVGGGGGKPGFVRVWRAATDGEVRAYLERAVRADGENEELRGEHDRFLPAGGARKRK
jgi:WD40 repeat protein